MDDAERNNCSAEVYNVKYNIYFTDCILVVNTVFKVCSTYAYFPGSNLFLHYASSCISPLKRFRLRTYQNPPIVVIKYM